MRRNADSTAMRSRCRVRARSRSSISRNVATCAKRCTARSSRAATMAERPTTRRSSPKWCGCAPNAPACLATPTSPTIGSPTPWRKRKARGAARSTRGGGGARGRAKADRDALQDLLQKEGGNFKLAPWDWRYYADKLRQERCDIDEAEIKPYLNLDRMIEAAFYTAERLFGLRFSERSDIPVWHPDVRVWDVRGSDGSEVGLFFGAYFARQSKRSGAWMTSLRDQEKLAGDISPLIINVCNFAKAPDGEPTLLSFDDARTLFHEFGHALHGLLSSVTYPRISGTSVSTDFVELPSQLYKHWLEQPDVLRRYARHYETGEPMPEELLKRLVSARNFNMGFATVE